MADVINILHLTDLHYTESWRHDQEVVISAFFEDVRRLRKNGLKPDFIVFSGDLLTDQMRKKHTMRCSTRLCSPF
ncbi:metallophosphoesterase [Geminicoccus flavidas]|uniref:metallophosphoesterase n=1 Tax=Geminicoccus flavidas TaxID=2506407 RepID=UPI0013592986